MGNVAIIPARGGSKRIPRKNIKALGGRPLIEYSIRAASETGLFDRIIVSTDSKKIADVARFCGAEVPFMRPPELSDDYTATAPVLLHAVEWLSANDSCPRYLCCIYATAPFINPEKIKEGYELLRSSTAFTAVSVTTYPYPIQRSLKIDEEGCLAMFWPEYAQTRSQDLPEAYHDAGQFYWAEVQPFIREETLFSSRCLPVFLDRCDVQDIDTMEDWQAAERMLTVRNFKTGEPDKGRVK